MNYIFCTVHRNLVRTPPLLQNEFSEEDIFSIKAHIISQLWKSAALDKTSEKYSPIIKFHKNVQASQNEFLLNMHIVPIIITFHLKMLKLNLFFWF